jgi:hypothetical protein
VTYWHRGNERPFVHGPWWLYPYDPNGGAVTLTHFARTFPACRLDQARLTLIARRKRHCIHGIMIGFGVENGDTNRTRDNPADHKRHECKEGVMMYQHTRIRDAVRALGTQRLLFVPRAPSLTIIEKCADQSSLVLDAADQIN